MSALKKPTENGFTQRSETHSMCMFCFLSVRAATPAILELEESDHCELCPVYPRNPSKENLNTVERPTMASPKGVGP
jgi:hypothetical protein